MAYAGSKLKPIDRPERHRLESQPFSRTGENPPYGMTGRIEETSASYEARSAPRSYPTRTISQNGQIERGAVEGHKLRLQLGDFVDECRDQVAFGTLGSEFLDHSLIRHLWHCCKCGARFESFPRFPANARLVKDLMGKTDIFPPPRAP
jgi:hypothetical protein